VKDARTALRVPETVPDQVPIPAEIQAKFICFAVVAEHSECSGPPATLGPVVDLEAAADEGANPSRMACIKGY